MLRNNQNQIINSFDGHKRTMMGNGQTKCDNNVKLDISGLLFVNFLELGRDR